MTQDVNVLVTFWSRTGLTEKLALAAALGAVQAKANIRLRWLREPALQQDADSVPGWRENRARMEKEYVAPREADLVWADATFLAIPANVSLAAPELRSYLELMAGLHQGGKLGCKVGAALLSAPRPAGQTDSLLAAAYASLAQFNLILVPPREKSADPLETARLHGRRVAEVARALKAVAI
jgi:NAD(P)H dehydrogenase (quinone)